MATNIKLYLLRKIGETVLKTSKTNPTLLKPLMLLGNGRSEQRFLLSLPFDVVENLIGVTNMHRLLEIQPDDIIKHVEILRDRANRKISFVIHHDVFIKEVLDNCAKPDILLPPRNIVIEYSSPNIAKPFHMGHLRSTIIGNFISNITKFLNNEVTRLNYLGNWGTQFGFIKVGVDELKHTPETIRSNPIQTLYESYVYANKLAETDKSVSDRARMEFSKLETGSESDMKYWNDFMGYTKTELESTYSRLGVKFDEYCYESTYNANAVKGLIDKLKKKHILQQDQDGKQVVEINKRMVSIVKSDGSTLYLTRDIAAAIDRFEKYKFDKMYYVVENGQSDHFNALKRMLYRLDMPWAERLLHVKFGRIHGMSTRKGKVVFLKDILDESRDLMIQRQIQSPTTKVPISDINTSDILGISCVIINDLKQRRQRDYQFSWDKVLQAEGDGGIKLQYTHCRLVNLELNSGAVIAQKCIPDLLGNDPVVTDLVIHLARFPETINRASEQLEACILVNYLFHLCNHVNKALKTQKVKGSDPDVGSQRLLLFNTARKVLHTGMSILGLKPLTKM